MITLLIPWPIVAVTAAGGDYSNTQPARLPSVTQQNVFLSVLIFGFPNSDFQNILIPRGPRVDLAWTSRGPRVDLAWTSRGPREKTKCVSNDRSRRDDQNAYRIIKIGAILGYFWPLQSLTPER